jgi:hypothetical protein
MSVLEQVEVSGAVGKQTFGAGRPVKLQSLVLHTPVSAATVEVRDGNASGDLKMGLTAPVGDSKPIQFSEEGVRFDKGMHVQVVGVGSSAFLEIN